MTSFVELRSLLILSCVASFSVAAIQCSKSESTNVVESMGGAKGIGEGGATNQDDGEPSKPGTSPGTSTGGSENVRCTAEGEIYCFGECLLAITDENCGACGHSCGAGSTCQEIGGDYTCACPDGLIRCGAACIDPDTHPRYCGASGACSTPAEIGTNCGEGGACVDASCLCDTEHTKCDGKCVDTNSDPEYCGTSPDECGSPCKTNALCNGGSCTCPQNTTECSYGCFDTNSAEEACGGCTDSGGVACDTAKGQECREGTCQCPVGWTLCGDTCRDLESDPAACGTCENSCSGDTPGCYEGSCVSGPCDAAVTSACDGVTLRTLSNCPDTDDHFSGGGIKCLGGVPNGEALCYQFDSSTDYEKFRCWWSGRSVTSTAVRWPATAAVISTRIFPAPRPGAIASTCTTGWKKPLTG